MQICGGNHAFVAAKRNAPIGYVDIAGAHALKIKGSGAFYAKITWGN